VQFPGLERLEDIAIRLCDLGPLQGLFICIGCHIDHRKIIPGPDVLCGLDAAQGALEPDVHQHQVGVCLVHFFNCPFARPDHRRDRVAQTLGPACNIQGDNVFVFNNQYARS
jgi:hypothetical protein